MLAEYGCRYVIVGHSGRRAYHAERPAGRRQGQIALAKGLAHRLRRRDARRAEAGQTDAVVKRQLSPR